MKEQLGCYEELASKNGLPHPQLRATQACRLWSSKGQKRAQSSCGRTPYCVVGVGTPGLIKLRYGKSSNISCTAVFLDQDGHLLKCQCPLPFHALSPDTRCYPCGGACLEGHAHEPHGPAGESQAVHPFPPGEAWGNASVLAV